jgi:hypothetical protein
MAKKSSFDLALGTPLEEVEIEQPPIEETGTRGKKSSFDIAEVMGKGVALGATPQQIDVSKYADYLPEGIYPSQDINLQRAIAQPWTEQLGGFLLQATGEIVGGTIEGAGYVGDLQGSINVLKGNEQEWGNWLSDIGKELKTWTQEAAPIYAESPGTFNSDNFFDSGWWFSNGVSVASTLSLMIPAAGVARGLAYLGKGMSSLAKMGKLGKKVAEFSKAGYNMTKAERAMAKWAGSGLTQAATSRHMENMMEASGVFEEQYEKYLSQGIEEEEARRYASEAASSVYKADWAMFLMDLPQYLAFGKIGSPNLADATGKVAAAATKSAGKAIGETALGKTGKYITGLLSEGFEEGYQFVQAEEGKYYGDLMAGKTEESAFSDRMDEYMKDGEMWTSVFFGALGGAAFQATRSLALKGYEGLTGKPGEATERAQERINNIKEWAPRMAKAHKNIIAAEAIGDPRLIEEAKLHANMEMSLLANLNGNGQTHVDYLEAINNMSAEELEAWSNENDVEGLDKAFVEEYVPRLLEDSKKIRDYYTEEIQNNTPNNAAIASQLRYLGDRYNISKKNAEEKLSKLKEQYKGIEDNLTSVGSQELEIGRRINGYRQTKKFINYLLTKEDLTAEKKKQFTNTLKEIKLAEADAKKRLANLKKSDAYKERTSSEVAKDNNVLSTISNINEIDKQQANIEFLDAAIVNNARDLQIARESAEKEIEYSKLKRTKDFAFNIEKKILDSGENSLNTIRTTGSMPAEVKTSFKGENGSLIYKNQPAKYKDKDGKEKNVKGYFFKSAKDGKETHITPENFDDLYVESQSTRDQDAIDAFRTEFLRREKQLIELKKDLVSKLQSNLEKADRGNKALRDSRRTLFTLQDTLADVLKSKNFDKRKKDTKQLIKELREEIARVEEQISTIENAISDINNSVEALTRELRIVQEELPALLKDFTEKVNTAKLSEENYIKANETIVKYEQLFHNPEELKNVINRSNDNISNLENLVEDLQQQLELLREAYNPAEVAQLILEKEEYTIEFLKKYPGAPTKEDIKNYNPKLPNGGLDYQTFLYLLRNPEFLNDLKGLQDIDSAVKVSQETKDNTLANIMSTRRQLVDARRNLRLTTELRDNYLEKLDAFQEAQALVNTYDNLQKVTEQLKKAATDQAIEAAKVTPDQNPIKDETPLEPKEDGIKEDFRYKRNAINATTGQHIEEDGSINSRTMQARWFAAMSRMSGDPADLGYQLKMVKFDPNTENPAFDGEDKNYEAQEFERLSNLKEGSQINKSDIVVDNLSEELLEEWNALGIDNDAFIKIVKINGKSERGTSVDVRITTPDGFLEKAVFVKTKPTTFKAVLVDKDGNPVLANDKGEIGKGDLILSTYVPTEGLVASMNGDALVDRYIKRVIKNKKGIAAIKEGKIKHGTDEYTKEQILEKAQTLERNKIKEFRAAVNEAINKGEDVFVDISGRTPGIARRLEKKADGSRNLQPLTNFASKKDIVAIHIPTDTKQDLSTGEVISTFPGMPIIEDKNGNITDGINRKLSTEEVDLVVGLLNYAANSQSRERGLNNTVKNADVTSKKFPSFQIFNTKGRPYGILPSIIYYGRSDKNAKYQIFISKGKLFFGEDSSIDVSEISTSVQLREWLSDKFRQVNNNKVGKSDSPYYNPTSFNPETGEVSGKWYKPSNNLGGYENFLIDDNVIGTDILPKTEVQYASSNLIFSLKVKTTPTIEASPSKPAAPKPAPTPIAPTAPKAKPTSTTVEGNVIKSDEDYIANKGNNIFMTRPLQAGGEIIIEARINERNNAELVGITREGKPDDTYTKNVKAVLKQFNIDRQLEGLGNAMGLGNISKITTSPEVVTRTEEAPVEAQPQANKADIERRRQEDREKPGKESVLSKLREKLSPGSNTISNMLRDLGAELQAPIGIKDGEITHIIFDKEESSFIFTNKGKKFSAFYIKNAKSKTRWQLSKWNSDTNSFTSISLNSIKDLNKKFGSIEEMLKKFAPKVVEDIIYYENLEYSAEDKAQVPIPLENSVSAEQVRLQEKYGSKFTLKDFLEKYDAELATLEAQPQTAVTPVVEQAPPVPLNEGTQEEEGFMSAFTLEATPEELADVNEKLKAMSSQNPDNESKKVCPTPKGKK